MFRAAVCLGLVAAGLGLHTWRAYSPEAPVFVPAEAVALEARFRSWDEHDQVRGTRGTPYILRIESSDAVEGPSSTGSHARSVVPAETPLLGISSEDPRAWLSVAVGERVPSGAALLYYGASHQSDPADPQVGDIESRWADFEPTVALCEGRNRGYFVSPLIERFAGRPEPAVVHGLARRDGIPLLSLEPSENAELAELLQRWPADILLLYYTLRVYASESGGRPDRGLAEHLLEKRRGMHGLEAALPDLEALEAAWIAAGYPAGAWLRMSNLPRYGPIDEIGSEVQQIRGQHMARTLVELSLGGERVFAVVGSGHVIRQEWALRQALGAPPADDQPIDQIVP